MAKSEIDSTQMQSRRSKEKKNKQKLQEEKKAGQKKISGCTKEDISGIRTVKHLRISGGEDEYGNFQESRLFDNLAHLHQLETLSFQLFTLGISKVKISPVTIPTGKAFPATLRKIKFAGTHLRWEYLDIIGELPNLEVLKLMCDACYGKEWNPIVGGFTKLKLLLIDESNLKYWKATNDNFPVLERLVIRECCRLEEIPIEFADIHTLQLIELEGCNPALEASTSQIQQEQEDLGTEPVHVRILKPYSGENVDDKDDDGDDDDDDNDDDDDDDDDEDEDAAADGVTIDQLGLADLFREINKVMWREALTRTE